MAGRPRVQIDPKQVELLAGCGATVEEIAAKLGVSERTLYRDFGSVIEKGRATGKMSLRGKQFERAMKGSDAMLIWLGKQLLGQRDKADVSITTVSDDELEAEVQRRMAIAAASMAGDSQKQ